MINIEATNYKELIAIIIVLIAKQLEIMYLKTLFFKAQQISLCYMLTKFSSHGFIDLL